MAIEGLEALQRKLALIPQSIIEEVRIELERQATEIVAMMKRLVPVESGALRNSISWTWGDAPAGSMVIGTVKAGAAKRGAVGTNYGSMAITIFAGSSGKKGDTFYARFQEFGTRKMSANPFFFVTYRAKKRSAKSAVTRAMKRAIKNA